jgi:hypothetical protein
MEKELRELGFQKGFTKKKKKNKGKRLVGQPGKRWFNRMLVRHKKRGKKS